MQLGVLKGRKWRVAGDERRSEGEAGEREERFHPAKGAGAEERFLAALEMTGGTWEVTSGE